MPAWILRLVWKLRGKRHVRIHLLEPRPTFEGILLGVWQGRYVLMKASVLEAEDRTHGIDGVAEIPREHVVFVQRLS
jgi:hypothetical protein